MTTAPSTLPPHVTWLDRAQNKLRRTDLIPRHDRELTALFQATRVTQITVCDVYSGYTSREEQRIILAIQVFGVAMIGSHIVKLGTAADVAPDVTGYRNCLLGQGKSSRMLMPVSGMSLGEGRWGVIYQNAYNLFGVDAVMESPRSLEEVTGWAITDRTPEIASIERILMQVYSELNRICYRGGQPDAARAREFYIGKLSSSRPNRPTAWDLWQDEKHLLLRRDAMWLATAQRNPESTEVPDYLDPYDYVRWALANGQVPSTSIGWSHGDLHGRNILVGVSRGEAEHPALFDFGDMRSDNVQVWDFVKLETELKVRLLPGLASPEKRAVLETLVGGPRTGRRQPQPPLSTAVAEAVSRADDLEFALLFELWLSRTTRSMTKGGETASSRAGIPDCDRSGELELDKALSVLLRIRREAATWLGFGNDRPNDWQEEYYFALAVYGLLKARWKPEARQVQWSLVSAGVAVAQLESAQHAIVQGFSQPLPGEQALPDLPSHLIPQHWGRRLWQDGQYSQACGLLGQAAKQFPAAVSLKLELALNLAADGQATAARELLDPLKAYCEVFGDDEALSRIGRVFKNHGDQAWTFGRPAYDDLSSAHPAWQNYNWAFDAYHRAFTIRRYYFPGINAACMALLTKRTEAAHQLAEEVLTVCKDLSNLPESDYKWCFASEGEAKLILGKQAEAVNSYAAALQKCGDEVSPIRSMYQQICRLCWALGESQVGQVVQLFNESPVNWREADDTSPLFSCPSD